MDDVMTKGFMELSAMEMEEIDGGIPSSVIVGPLSMFIPAKYKAVVAVAVAVCVAKAKKLF